MNVQQPEILRKYHEAVKNNDPRAEEYLREWQESVRLLLQTIGENVVDRKAVAMQIVQEKRRGVAPLYSLLKEDYREAVRLSREISLVKKLLRERKVYKQ